MSDVYHDIFQSWADVQREYEMDWAEPDEVLYANYSYEDYTGDSDVVYRNGPSIFWQRGSHCSCFGLEGQWDPEEYSPELFVEAWERRNWHNIPETVLDRVKELMENKYNGA
jgi:hypothetical protein